jgi:prepilin-type processing-associated H-X9-DG protein
MRRKSSHSGSITGQGIRVIDNHPNTMAGGTFIVFPSGSPDDDHWSHFPNWRHQNGFNLSFADGHVEHWRWREALNLQRAKETTWVASI